MSKIINLSIVTVLSLPVFPVLASQLSVSQMNINLDKCYQQSELVYQTADPKELSVHACTKVISNEWLSRSVESNTRLNRGLIYMAQGKHQKAKKDFIRSLRFNPDSYPAHVALAQLLYKENDFVGSLRHYDLAITLNNNDAKLNKNRQLAFNSVVREEHNRLANNTQPKTK